MTKAGLFPRTGMSTSIPGLVYVLPESAPMTLGGVMGAFLFRALLHAAWQAGTEILSL